MTFCRYPCSPRFTADDGKPRHIIRIVFNIFGNQVQPIVLACFEAGNRRGASLMSGNLSGSGRTGHFNRSSRGKMFRQPLTALRQCLRLAIDLGDLRSRALTQQTVMNPHPNLAANPGRLSRQHVERVGDSSVRGIFEWNNAQVGESSIDFFEDCRNRRHRRKFDTLSETLNRRQMAVTVLRPQIGNLRGFDKVARPAGDLTKNGP